MQQVDDFEDDYDYVFLSDIENDPSSTDSSVRETTEAGVRGTAKGKKGVSIGSSHTINTTSNRQAQGSSGTVAFQQRQRTPESQRSESESDQDDGAQDQQDELDESDGEEIEYGYETDLLVIMPAMLRNYSHHATNYHPELWRPSPSSSGRYSPQQSSARCRQEDRVLDREELLKNTIPSTTCGICFESFMTFDLEPLQQQQEQQLNQQESAATSTRVQFARTFTERLAQSFSRQNSSYSHSHQQQQIPGNSSNSATSTSTATQESLSPTNSPSTSVARAPTITPSVSSKELGVVLPCDHGLCLSCLQSFLLNATQNPQARFPTVCPQPGCRTPIPTESAEWVLDKETLEIWYRKLAEIHVANKVCCPLPECRSILDLDDRDGTAVTCPECRNSFCASCAVPFHRGLSCEQYRLQSFCYACGHPWNEMDARCSRDCESEGVHDDMGVDCLIM
ncbi:hypothetical protein BGX33_008384 [Mortierella sp. NVP41]|nr:hypothetical protein BGX33_008384 [Mortierella sp. NVP41]